MSLLQTPTEPIKGRENITKALEETIASHGYPSFSQSHLGLYISIQTKSMVKNEYADLCFLADAGQFLFLLDPDKLTLIPTDRPKNDYMRKLKACYAIQQERTDVILGWLCWE